MASRTAGTKPPTRATTITATRYTSTSLIRLIESRALVRTTVSSGASSAASTYPAIWRRRVSPPPARGRPQPRPAAGPEHELGGVLGAGEREQRLRDVVPHHLVVAAAEGLDQPPLRGQRGGVGAGQPVRLGDVHREQVAAGGAGRDPGGTADQRVAFRPFG